MCVVSMVHTHFQEPFRHWPQTTGPSPAWIPDPQSVPNIPALPPVWDWKRWDEYQELLRKAKVYDEMMKQADCPDPAKEALMKEIERKLVEKYGLHPKEQT